MIVAEISIISCYVAKDTSYVISRSGNSSFISKTIRLVVAVFLSVSIIAPALKLEIKYFPENIDVINSDANTIVSDSQALITNEITSVITQRIESYIEDKAALYGATINASVNMKDTSPYIPDTVVINGNISPYGKISLKKIISEDLGIPEAQQIWN